MNRILCIVCLCLAFYGSTMAQSKARISALGATLVSDVNEQTQLNEMELSVIFNIDSIYLANSVSVGIGNTSLTSDEITTIFEVVYSNKKYFLVEQNVRIEVQNGTVTVFVHLPNTAERYRGKYAIVTVTDKEGHTSRVQSVVIQ